MELYLQRKVGGQNNKMVWQHAGISLSAIGEALSIVTEIRYRKMGGCGCGNLWHFSSDSLIFSEK